MNARLPKIAPATIRGPKVVSRKELRQRAKQTEQDAASVEVVAVHDILERTFGPDYHNVPFKRQVQFVRNWCDTMGAAYYSAEKQEFNERAAQRKAARLGLRRVVVECLS